MNQQSERDFYLLNKPAVASEARNARFFFNVARALECAPSSSLVGRGGNVMLLARKRVALILDVLNPRRLPFDLERLI